MKVQRKTYMPKFTYLTEEQSHKIKIKMLEKKTNLDEMSLSMGTYASTLSRKLLGRSPLNTIEVARISNLLELTPDELIKYFFGHKLRNATKQTRQPHCTLTTE